MNKDIPQIQRGGLTLKSISVRNMGNRASPDWPPDMTTRRNLLRPMETAMNARPEPMLTPWLTADATPIHEARVLTEGGSLAKIVLDGQVYTLRITRQGKLILTK